MKFPKYFYIVWHKAMTGQGWYEVATTIEDAVDEAHNQGGEVVMYTFVKRGKPKLVRDVIWQAHRGPRD